MEIISPEIKRTVFDYEFVLSSGIAFPITIDPEKGDSIEYLKGMVHIHLTRKPHPSDPTKTSPEEDHTIFLRHVASSTKRERTVTELTQEQREAWKKVFQEPSRSIM